jgi:hypothetical protein
MQEQKKLTSQAQVWQVLLANGMVQDVNPSSAHNGLVYKITSGQLCVHQPFGVIVPRHTDRHLHAVTFSDAPSGGYIQYMETEWYDNIPPDGVLCGVSNDIRDSASEYTIALITNCFNGMFREEAIDCEWKYAYRMTASSAIEKGIVLPG